MYNYQAPKLGKPTSRTLRDSNDCGLPLQVFVGHFDCIYGAVCNFFKLSETTQFWFMVCFVQIFVLRKQHHIMLPLQLFDEVLLETIATQNFPIFPKIRCRKLCSEVFKRDIVVPKTFNACCFYKSKW